MKTILMAFVMLLASAVSAQPVQDNLLCVLQNNYFKVSDGIKTWEKFVSDAANPEAIVRCGSDTAAVLVGPYFVSFDLQTKRFSEKYVNGAAGYTKKLEVYGRIAVGMMGPYFFVSDGGRITEKYVASPNPYARIIAGDGVAGALMGNYFVTYNQGVIREEYVGAATELDSISAGGRLVVASIGSYFLAFDSLRKKVYSKYIGDTGQVSVRKGLGVHQATRDGKITSYNAETGKFKN